MSKTRFQTIVSSGLLTATFGCTSTPQMSPDAPPAPKRITAATQFDFTTFDANGAGTTVNSINNKGAVVGFTTSTSAAGDPISANFLRSSDATLKPLALGDPAGSANGLNSAELVVGIANDTAITLEAGVVKPLSPLGAAQSVAFGVNDHGVIVGQYTKDANTMPGFVDENGTFTSVDATAASTMTFMAGINSDGLCVGFYSEDGTTQHGFTYDVTPKTVALLGDPSTPRITASPLVLTQFLGVNDQGQAVGYYQTADDSQYGFVYDLPTHTYIFLDHPKAASVAGVQITQITGINSSNEIAGFFIDAAGDQHGFVASPIE